jgi:endonuclease/exonuclease/phosphatase family metal-dependent hydrolase
VQQAAVFAPVVLLGDLNASPEADELAPLWTELHDAHDGVARIDRTTFPAATPPDLAEIVDYVLVSPTTRVTHAEVVRDEEKASDHDLCVAELSL